MRDPARIKVVMAALERLWSSYPDLRFGQLVLNIEGNYDDLWNMEEPDFLKAMKHFDRF